MSRTDINKQHLERWFPHVQNHLTICRLMPFGTLSKGLSSAGNLHPILPKLCMDIPELLRATFSWSSLLCIVAVSACVLQHIRWHPNAPQLQSMVTCWPGDAACNHLMEDFPISH